MAIKDLSLNGARSELLTTLDDWLALDTADTDRPIVEVPVPEFGRTVLLRAMSQADRDEWELRYTGDMTFALSEDQRKERDAHLPRKTVREVQRGMKARLITLCVVNERGDRILSEAQVELLQRRNSAAINRLAERADELCGITQADREALERAKNGSAPARENAPPSD